MSTIESIKPKEKIQSRFGHEINEKEFQRIHQLYNELMPTSPWSEKFMKQILFDESRSPLYNTFEIEGESIGLVLGRLLKDDKDVFNISSIGVKKEHRHKKIATKLMQSFIKDVFEQTSVKKIIVHFRESKNLKSFYEKLGFSGHKIVGTYKNKEAKHYMELLRREDEERDELPQEGDFEEKK